MGEMNDLTDAEVFEIAFKQAIDESMWSLDLVRAELAVRKIEDSHSIVEMTKMTMMWSKDIARDLVRAMREGKAKEQASKPSEKPSSPGKPQESTGTPSPEPPATGSPQSPPEDKIDAGTSYNEAFDTKNKRWLKCPGCGNEDIHKTSVLKTTTDGRPKEYSACFKCKTYLNIDKYGKPSVKPMPPKPRTT